MAAKTPKTLDGRIDNVIKRSANLGLDIHNVAIECLKHAEEHGDPRKLDRLAKGLHASCRPVALMEWAKKYSPITWNGDGEVKMIPVDNKKFVPFDIEAADLDPYWTPAEVIAKPLTLEALKKMIATMEAKVKKAEEGKAQIADGENIVEMRAYVDRIKAAA